MGIKLKVLIVDDNEKFCNNMADILEFKGYEVKGVYSGYQAIEAVNNQKYDIALLDIKMPGMDGVETLKILKSIDPDLNIIMITAFSDDVMGIDEITIPNLKTMQKPMDIDKLCWMLESIK